MSATAAAPPASAADDNVPAYLVVIPQGPDGRPTGHSSTFDLATIQENSDTSGFYQSYVAGRVTPEPGPLAGTSITAMLEAANVNPADVQAATLTPYPGGNPVRLEASAGDFAEPSSSGYPFTDSLPPLFARDRSVSDQLFFAVNTRTVRNQSSGLADGQNLLIGTNGYLTATVRLSKYLVVPEVRATPTTVEVGKPVAFTARLGADGRGAGVPAWDWTWGDGSTSPGIGAETNHVFRTPGTYSVVVDATGPNASGRSTAVSVHVVGASPPTTSPPRTQTGRGTAATTAPVNGPVTGNGPRAGGVPTGRTGPTGAGATFDPRSSGAPSATASGTATPKPGTVISGFALSEPIVVAQATRVGATPRNDAAAASRAGSTTNRVGEWTLGGLAVVLLLALGVLSERRRPRHRGRPPA